MSLTIIEHYVQTFTVLSPSGRSVKSESVVGDQLKVGDYLQFRSKPTFRTCHPSESVGLRGRLLRRIEALKAKEIGSEVPDEFLCPITRELMEDPVIAAGKRQRSYCYLFSLTATSVEAF